MTIHVFGASLADSDSTLTGLVETTGQPAMKHSAPGKTLPYWLRLLPSAGVERGDTIVVIESGGNGVPSPEQVRGADQALWQSGASKVVWVTFASWPETSRAYEARLQTRDIVRANTRQSIVLPKPSLEALSSDQVHFTGAGYRTMGGLIGRKLMEAGRGGSRGAPTGLYVGAALLAVTGFVFWKVAR